MGLLASAVSYLLQSQAWRPAGGGKLRLAAQVREDRISPVYPVSPFFARFHRLDDAVPTSPKTERMAKKRRHERQTRELGPSFDTPDA